MNPLFISFYTGGNGYEEEAFELLKTLRMFRLDNDVRCVGDSGDWTKNCGHKSAFILQMMEEHPGRPLVWVDADARVRKFPRLFGMLAGCDFAAHWRNDLELLSGTMYWGPTPGAKALATAWRAEQELHPKAWDQRVLSTVIERMRHQLVIGKLPASYTAIFDAQMVQMSEEVITHLQASRKLRVDA